MNRERLELMITMLQEVVAGTWTGLPVDHKLKLGPVKLIGQRIKGFDMSTWVSGDNKCGFAGCAVGHACYDKRFNDIGLHMAYGMPQFGTNHRWYAVQDFFGIDREIASILFHPRYYEGSDEFDIKPEQVVCRILELLTVGEDELIKNHSEPTKPTETE